MEWRGQQLKPLLWDLCAVALVYWGQGADVEWQAHGALLAPHLLPRLSLALLAVPFAYLALVAPALNLAGLLAAACL